MRTMPGFTADAALGGSSGQYRGVAQSTAAAGVLAQLRRSIGFCMADCDFSNPDPLSNAACKFDCMEGGDDGPGGPGEQVCRPSCGPCVQGVRTCITRDCDVIERTCGRNPRPRFALA